MNSKITNASDTSVIESNGVAPDWRDSIVFNENSIASTITVVAALTLMFSVNRPLMIPDTA